MLQKFEQSKVVKSFFARFNGKAGLFFMLTLSLQNKKIR
ncbi:hypothetical protein ADIS_3989 [Lunatimonas lonarensis]|uniref:Uncharacterized protein n=1 Tax=Lunatimonas lonarensis TaxID=1232681 RepID=R7ZNB5_9BACT|nr:hypothetical protein ADIS_3989 [Lunatimonas lonarensis]